MPNLFSRLSNRLSVGILVAATGVGAGDIVLAGIAGGEYGMLLLWAIVLGAVLKYVLNLGLAKWDVATGTTFLQGWVQRLPKVVSIYFGVYLVFWAFLVAGTLITFNGLVANTIFPLAVSEAGGVAIWGGLQSVLVAGMIYQGGFRLVENLMKAFIGLMFIVMVASALMVCPSWPEMIRSSLLPRMGTDLASLQFVAGLVGGVGGTVTILCYSYWLREKQAGEAASLKEVRQDLGVAYALTAVFGMAVMIIAAGVAPGEMKGYKMVVAIANELESILGAFGRWAFLLGFWAAVFTSMVGVWNGVPYLFADFLRQYRQRISGQESPDSALTHSPAYWWFLAYLAGPPILIAAFGKPIWIALAYAISGAFFMPFLAALVLYMNNKAAWVGKLKNGWGTNALLVICLLLFLGLLVGKVAGG
ncbi:Nramp family divalent metal transporter [Neolewinella agarilytica]|uniref:Mn2+ and Fe2+ transporters of the NRAMP family n=1 Tax=Neolewinella agarilytica TaxID=478744 RepID=A0A1H9MI78_9BACT|nr:Nramp family divalent metal transporter [Neolewinella agarilytica]SER23416.1 Mn2+ and Fe2+ transporters of the NRAMP family [Neolewinella agarilytica]